MYRSIFVWVLFGLAACSSDSSLTIENIGSEISATQQTAAITGTVLDASGSPAWDALTVPPSLGHICDCPNCIQRTIFCHFKYPIFWQ